MFIFFSHFPKFDLKVLECDILKVFETYKPVKVLSSQDNALMLRDLPVT